ncbi:F-box/kelch-repeat protein At3g23880-like [Lotus japonicus]|uniref:F-box/kelch-repeat protein At3g23880-like n=1 Tax=Lotus japonicus TaxID=34305 RepID=UPI0025871EEF|nr:F-box/kelch-repeat protein At3g23880-like [Lotus japonicus]XP_057422645.1 F-box/kelch-repeat protein At3g23880-like [Lotus japonicus]
MLETTNMKQPPPPLLLSLVLPEELIIEILLKLPVRSLLRFICVCKSWKTLIDSPQFVKDHLRNSMSDTNMTRQQLVSFAKNESNKIETCSVQSLFENPSAPPEILSFRVESKHQYIVGSCYGLMCLCDHNGYFRLWNPSTRLASVRSPRINIVKLFTRYGFGYDQVNDKYKVLYTRGFETRVHTFGTNCWTTIHTSPRARPEWSDEEEGKFVSGTLNWLAPKRDCIISFDLENETYDEVLLPLQLHDDSPRNHVLDALSNCLCLSYSNNIHCAVWLMKKYGIQESWTKLISIPRWKLQIPKRPRCVRLSFHLRPLCISENVVVLVRSNDGHVVMFNTNNGKLKFPKIKGRISHDMHIYHECLVSPL